MRGFLLGLVAGGVVAWSVTWLVGRDGGVDGGGVVENGGVVVEKVVVRVSVVVRCPVVRDSVVVRTLTRRVVVRDSVRDSVRDVVLVGDSVVMPVVQRVYGDSTFRAWVSGYDVRLDSVEVFPRTVVVTRRAVVGRRWSVGVQGGLGVTPRGVLPYVGVGVGWRLF